MNLKLVEKTELKMSSREIAELCVKRHDNVLRDIKKMLTDLELDHLNFEGSYKDQMGRAQKDYSLPKNLTLNLISGYRSDIRLKIIDRWIELETKPISPEEFLLQQAQITYEHSKRLQLVENRLEKLDPDTGYRTVTAHCKMENISLPLKAAGSLGRKLSKLCKDRKIEIGHVPDERFGTVNSYPINLIEEALSEID